MTLQLCYVSEQDLSMLDVLDLHDNLLDTADGFDDLLSLRVLNLAGNRISRLYTLAHLSNLVELNLKRNSLLSLHPVDVPDISSRSMSCIPGSLKFLFLSHNKYVFCEDILLVFYSVDPSS